MAYIYMEPKRMSVTDISDVVDVIKRTEHSRTSCSDHEEWTTTRTLGLIQLALKITHQHPATASRIIIHTH